MRMVGSVGSWVRYIYIANNVARYHTFLKYFISCIITAFGQSKEGITSATVCTLINPFLTHLVNY